MTSARRSCVQSNIIPTNTMTEHWDPKDKTFLITGGASGLGARYTERFLSEGAKKVIILDISEEKGEELAGKLNITYPDKAIFYRCDVANEMQLTEVFNDVVTKFKRVDVIINNAAIMCDTKPMWMQSIDINLRGLISLTFEGVQHMREDEGGAGGTVINVSSCGALLRLPYVPVYSATKSAIFHFSQCLAADPFLTNAGVRILVFCLNVTETNILKNLKDRAWHMKAGKELEDVFVSSIILQKPESATDAMVKMFKEGTHGSIWLSTSDKPAKDITPVIDTAFKSFEPLFQ